MPAHSSRICRSRKPNTRRCTRRLQRNFSPQELARLEEMRNRFPSADQIKIPTAFLISICGLKGHRIGGAQVNETQPLVLLNQGGATAADVIALAQHVRKTVRARTGMALAIEPELVGFTQQELADIQVSKQFRTPVGRQGGAR